MRLHPVARETIRKSTVALVRHAAREREEQRVPWHERPYLPVPTTAAVLGVSCAKVYQLAVKGRLRTVRLLGQTRVETTSVAEILAQAEPLAPAAAAARRGAA